MKFRAVAAMMALVFLLSGCSAWWDGEYHWKEEYSLPQSPESGQLVSASNYEQMKAALQRLVETGKTQAAVSVAEYPAAALEADVASAVDALMQTHPITAYAVDAITWEIGTSAGEPVLGVQILYLHDRTEIRNIKTVADDTAATEAVQKALADFQPGIVLQILDYNQADFTQMVEDYALLCPQTVMEVPKVIANVYPETGQSRVVELKFTYQTSRDALKTMQSQVEPVFSSAVLYVSGDGQPVEKYSQLYSFLVERFDYSFETSITPAYSLLRHGVGDSRAFATVYASMCRMAGLTCLTVSGTRDGESHYWNIIYSDGAYYHLDLLRCAEETGFCLLTDDDMAGYVWDYSAYPECGEALSE
ncbi:MAG: transglutaminase domain-containing protein [Ruminococcaceae bacterium]|nr:transglutaminase domain-containing protein [Oscillospiraceae bacterium]